jgi:ATP-dependent Lhr-like helicase
MADHQVLEGFSKSVSAWFASSFPQPTTPQIEGWPHIRNGEHTLICAPTGSGKTLTAFLSCIDHLVSDPLPPNIQRTRVLYISPLRALAFDVEKNLRAPIVGIQHAAERLGEMFVEPTVGIRTGDTSSKERKQLVRNPPDILITTPESLFLMLTSAARETLANVDTVIIDEIHALAPTKRGAHLMVSLERLEEITTKPFQRIGLSATQRPLEEVARFLGGSRDGMARKVQIVNAGVRKELDVQVVVAVEDMGDLGKPTTELRSGPATAALTERRSSIWPSVYPKILDLVLEHKSTIIFCNARRQAERLAANINELAVERGVGGSGVHELVKAHHGSLAREQRVIIEDQLKRGELRALVATSSLELGIDMGAVDLVIQVESPGAVSRGMQRVGRAGHQVGQPSIGKMFPKHRHDLLEAAIVSKRMMTGEIESTRFLRNPLDVLAQQIVAHVAMNPQITRGALTTLLRRCANFADLSDDVLTNVLDLLSGRYPSQEFAELKPRLVWDRIEDTLRAREGAQRLAVTNGGTIPDRGLFGVFLPDGTRVGELDEEMVYETRPGETFILGASTWRIEDITFDRVTVSPAPGQQGKMPFWHGDGPGRPLELGRAFGEFIRTIRERDGANAYDELVGRHGLDDLAARNVVQYLAEQAEATGSVPNDRTIVVERFRDDLGDWRVCIHSPFGTPVHAPWAMAIQHRLSTRFEVPVDTMWSDDGIVIRLPEAMEELSVDDIALDPTEVHDVVVATLPQTSLFAARFRECAARALLLPRRRPGQRTPLWQQRQRAADLLAVAAKYPTFPILLETSRECIQDVFDVPALAEVLTQLHSRAIALVTVDTPKPSPFAQSLLFNWIATYMYEGDAPLAERRAAALSLDRDLLNDLLGTQELRELLDPQVLIDVECELQCLVESRQAKSPDEVHDLLRRLGDLTLEEIELRSIGDAQAMVDGLVADMRTIAVQIGGEERLIAAEDAARYRDALGCALPLGLPSAFTDPVDHPLDDLVGRYARTHGPFVVRQLVERYQIGLERATGVLDRLAASGRIVDGEFRPRGIEREWCDVEVLRQLRRRSLALLRKEIEPVEQRAYARFLASWQGIPPTQRGQHALVEAISVMQGCALVASSLETDVLRARVRGYQSVDLDALCTSGEVVWVGSGAIGSTDGRIRLYFADQLPLLRASVEELERPMGEIHDAIRRMLAERGARFFTQLREAAPQANDTELLTALWDLVWTGEVTNDSLAPLRALLSSKPSQRNESRSGPTYTRMGRRSGARLMRSRAGTVSRVGPPAGAGRWSLVADLAADVSPTESLHATVMQLLERYGVLTREAVLGESTRGGFAGVYGVLKMLEERGTVRRGYFVEGLGAAQFALPGAVDRLRAERETVDVELHPDRVPEPIVLSATDPAQPYGSTMDWPTTTGRPSRSAGALVVIEAGDPLVWFDVRSHHLVVFDAALERLGWIEALESATKDGRMSRLEVRKVNGSSINDEDVVVDAVRAALVQAGFTPGYRGFVKLD